MYTGTSKTLLSNGDLLSMSCMCITKFIITLTAEPNEPTHVTAIQIKDSNGKCFIHCSWFKPNNSDESNVTQYNVYINGTLYPDLTTRERANRIVVYLSNFDCANHTISVRAINDCGEGTASPNVTTVPSHFSPNNGKSGPPSKAEWLKML